MTPDWLLLLGQDGRTEEIDEQVWRVARVVAAELVGWWNDITPSLAREEPDGDEWAQAKRIAAALIEQGLIPKEGL